MKKFLFLFFALLLVCAPLSASAQVPGMSSGNIITSLWQLQSDNTTIEPVNDYDAEIVNLTVTGTLTFSGVMGGDLDLDSNKIYNGYAEFTPDVEVTSDTNDGSTKPIVALDSDSAEVFSVDSDGGVSATTLALTGATSTGDLTISKSEAEAYLKFDVDYATPLDDDPIAHFQFNSKDDAGADITYAEIYAEIKDSASPIADGRLDFKVAGDAVLRTGMYIQGVGSYAQVQFVGDANFQRSLSMGDNQNFVLGGTGGIQAVLNLSTAQTNSMFRIGSSANSNVVLFDNGSTTNDQEIPVQTENTVAIASSSTYDPDDSNNAWMAYQYDGDLVVFGADQEGVGDTPAILNNGVNFDLSDITDTQTDSYGLRVERDIDDSNAAGGSDTYAHIWSDMTISDGTGADYEYLYLGTTGGTDVFSVDEEGTIVSPRTYLADITTPTNDRFEIYHGASGSVAGASTHAKYTEAYYGGNVAAGTADLVNVYTEGMTTAGNLVAGRSTTVNGHASDVANSFLAGAIYDFNANSTGAASTGVACLFTNDPWDYCTIAVAGDNVMSAVLVGPGDGKRVGLVGGAGVTGGSAQSGGDVYVQLGANSGGGDDGNFYIYDTDGTTVLWGLQEDGVSIHDELLTDKSSQTVADDGTITLDTGVVGILTVWVEDEYMRVYVNSDGAITSLEGSTNTAITDSDTDLCVYDGGTGAVIKNRLGASKTVGYTFDYIN